MSAPHLDVRYIANLVRLRLNEEEIAELQPQLDHVLSYIEQLDEVNVDGIEPTAHASAVYNVFRADVPRDGEPDDADEEHDRPGHGPRRRPGLRRGRSRSRRLA